MPIRGFVQNESGFSIAELAVVLMLLSILTSAMTIGVQYARERARMAIFYSDIRQYKLAAQRFEQDIGFYPMDVSRGVDPGLVEKYGWKDGDHSEEWEQAERDGRLSTWSGPYLDDWKRNPWGGYYDWDNYPPGYNYMGITGGAVYLTLKPISWGGKDGLPADRYEDILEQNGIDRSPWPQCIAVLMGSYPN